jgi:predicted unusual protein kinase regulating ubiquinone biosynthesis (AarF/ABC1/UbiB family)
MSMSTNASIIYQLLETGFFHADPHPGNLLVTKDGRLALIDFGLMADVPIQVIVYIQQYFSVPA